MPEPRGRLAQAAAFEMTELLGRPVEQLVAYGDHINGPDAVDIVAFRLAGDRYWHRVFLDAGIGFWEEWDTQRAFGPYEDEERFDLAARWGLRGQPVLAAACVGAPAGSSRFAWRLPGGTLRFVYRDLQDIDGPTTLRFEPASPR